MQPELSSEICDLYQVLFETRQKLEFLNQIYKLRASLIDELLHPQFSTSTCSTDEPAATKLASNSTSLMREEKPQPPKTESLTKSVPSIPEAEQESTAHGAFDFTQLDLLILKAKKVRNVEKPQKIKKEDSNQNNKKECAKIDEAYKPSSVVSKSDRIKQTVMKPRIQSSLSAATPKSTYQSSYSKRPFLQQKRRGVKTQSCSLPPIRFEERHTADPSIQELFQTRVVPKEQLRLSEDMHTQHNSIPNDAAPKLPTNRTENRDVPLSFPPPYSPPPLPPELAEALRDLKRAQVELATFLRTDHTKLLSPGRDLINEFDSAHRGDETAADRLQYACKLYREIETGAIPSDVKSFFLDSLQPHISASTGPSSTGFVYPCLHCSDPSTCSTEGIQIPRSFLLRELNLCSLLSHCYPGSLLSRSRLINRERLQCVDLNQFLELQLLTIDVFSLSVKKDVLATCMKVVPALDLEQREDRQVLRIIVSMLDSSKLVSFFNYNFTDD